MSKASTAGRPSPSSSRSTIICSQRQSTSSVRGLAPSSQSATMAGETSACFSVRAGRRSRDGLRARSRACHLWRLSDWRSCNLLMVFCSVRCGDPRRMPGGGLGLSGSDTISSATRCATRALDGGRAELGAQARNSQGFHVYALPSAPLELEATSESPTSNLPAKVCRTSLSSNPAGLAQASPTQDVTLPQT